MVTPRSDRTGVFPHHAKPFLSRKYLGLLVAGVPTLADEWVQSFVTETKTWIARAKGRGRLIFPAPPLPDDCGW